MKVYEKDEVDITFSHWQCDLDQLTIIDAIPMSVIKDIRAEIGRVAGEENVEDTKWAAGLRYSLKIIDKFISGKEKG